MTDMPHEIYLDNAATTQTDPEVAEAALHMMQVEYGNPSSLHKKGLQAQLALDKARSQVAKVLDCLPEELIFTSGGTEANNLALLGGAEALRRRGNHIVTTAYEHASVLESAKQLEKLGFAVTYVPPGPDGTVSPTAIAEAVTDQTILVSCMLVNSETGALIPMGEVAALVRRRNKTCLIHGDAVQAFGKIPLSAKKMGVDLLTLSAHKIHGPKGCGALFVRKGVRLRPLLFGGGQEKSLRPGTENTALIAAFGKAAEKAGGHLAESYEAMQSVCKFFANKSEQLPGLCRNSPANATPYIVNISLPGYRSETLIHHLAAAGIYVSGGSACAKGAKSHVLTAMGLPDDRIAGSLRVSFARTTTTDDIERFFAVLQEGLDTLVHAKTGGRS